MKIRKYKSSDRKAVEFIQFETGFLGKSMKNILTDNKLWKEDIEYYLEKEPESCFVAVNDKNKVVGYLLGCLDDKNHGLGDVFKNIFLNVFRISFLPKKDRKYWGGGVKMVFKSIFHLTEEHKFNPPKDSGHIHINLLLEARGKGTGTKLLKEFFKYAKSKGVKTIHADSFETKVNPNTNFWSKNGFNPSCKIKTGIWKDYLPNENINIICYVKKL